MIPFWIWPALGKITIMMLLNFNCNYIPAYTYRTWSLWLKLFAQIIIFTVKIYFCLLVWCHWIDQVEKTIEIKFQRYSFMKTSNFWPRIDNVLNTRKILIFHFVIKYRELGTGQNLSGTRAGTIDRGAQTFFRKKIWGRRLFFEKK